MTNNTKKLKQIKITRTQQILIALLIGIMAVGFCAVGFKSGSTAFAEQSVTLVEQEATYQIYNNKKTWAVKATGEMSDYVIKMASYEFTPRLLTVDTYIFENTSPEANYSWTMAKLTATRDNDHFGMLGKLFVFYGSENMPANVDASNVHIYKKVYSEITPLPATPTKVGYTFNGWYFDEACTQAYDNSPINADTTLYAGWTINKYNVNYYINGTVNSTDSIDYQGKATNKSISEVGKTFGGWYKDVACTQAFNFDTEVITADTAIYGKLDTIQVTVTFIVDSVVFKTITVDYGTVFAQSAQAVGAMKFFNLAYASADIDLDTLILTDDTTLSVVINPAVEKWLNFALFMQSYWWAILIGVVALGGGIGYLVWQLKRAK